MPFLQLTIGLGSQKSGAVRGVNEGKYIDCRTIDVCLLLVIQMNLHYLKGLLKKNVRKKVDNTAHIQ